MPVEGITARMKFPAMGTSAMTTFPDGLDSLGAPAETLGYAPSVKRVSGNTIPT